MKKVILCLSLLLTPCASVLADDSAANQEFIDKLIDGLMRHIVYMEYLGSCKAVHQASYNVLGQDMVLTITPQQSLCQFKNQYKSFTMTCLFNEEQRIKVSQELTSTSKSSVYQLKAGNLQLSSADTPYFNSLSGDTSICELTM